MIQRRWSRSKKRLNRFYDELYRHMGAGTLDDKIIMSKLKGIDKIMLNKVEWQGRLTADPELRFTKNETPVCNFSVAVGRGTKDADGNWETDFFDCTAWNKNAENLAKWCHKGDMVLLVGRMQNDSFIGNDGVKRTKDKLIVQELHFIGKVQRAATAGDTAQEQRNPTPAELEGTKLNDFNLEEFEEILFNEEVPF